MSIDLVIEATGAMAYGARVILDALGSGKDVVSMNAELDATIGYLLHHRAPSATGSTRSATAISRGCCCASSTSWP